MDPKLLEACLDDIEPIQSTMHDDIQRCSILPCTKCGGRCCAELDLHSIYRNLTEGEMGRFHYLSRCTECRRLYDPDLGIVIEIGNLAATRPHIPILHPEND